MDHINTIKKYRKQSNKFNNTMINLRSTMAEELNYFLKGNVRITLTKGLKSQDLKYLRNDFAWQVTKKAHRYKDYQVIIRDLITRICEFANEDFNFFALLCDNKVDTIINQYNLSSISKINEHLNYMCKCFTPDLLLILPESKISLKYNINSGYGKNEQYRHNYELSLGQNAVALLLIVLKASHSLNDDRPLLMDQPEDDLDNNYIYSTLIGEFRKSKKNRQIIISTHNANIPVAADAENVIVLEFTDGHGLLKHSGSLNKPDIADAILNILEGGEAAFNRRKFKYGLLQK